MDRSHCSDTIYKFLMNITFNVKDELGVAFIAAAKWSLENQALDDDTAIKRGLKKHMAALVDAHTRYLMLGTDEATLTALKSAAETSRQQLMQAEEAYWNKKRMFEATSIPIDPEAI
jgi:hypothetical protein